MRIHHRASSRRRLLLGLLALALAIGATTACDPAKQVQAWGGVSQVRAQTVPDALVALYDKAGRLVPTTVVGDDGKPAQADFRRTDEHGYVIFRYVAVGSGYTVRRIDSTQTKPSVPVTVHSKYWEPDRSLYTSQTMTTGFGYLKTRDGTLLSYMVRLPGPASKGPYPTLVEYSGYAPSDPYEIDSRSATQQIANALGYATVGVNLRGSGCSGGSFQLWEDAQLADGYDAIETIAAQPWVQGHRVGLFGVSYPGNGALYAASTQPPSLAAVAVAGTYDDGFRDLLRPGGIVNTGFARNWIASRYAEATPATAEPWVKRRIAEGDAVCKLSMEQRGQMVDYRPLIDQNPYFPTYQHIGDSLAPATVVSRIEVPTFISASWQDEQVGGHMPTMISNFTGTDHTRFVLTNGGHADLYAVPETMQRWNEFVSLYVARKTPSDAAIRLVAPIAGEAIVGSPVDTVPFPAERFTGKTYAQAKAAFEAEPPVEVLFENGGGADGTPPGSPHPTFEASFPAYPPPSTQAQRWYFGPGGTLSPTAPTVADGAADSSDAYQSDPSARPAGLAIEHGIWSLDPGYTWTDPVPGKSLAYLSPPLAQDTVMVGSASVDLWLRSSATDTDLQATLTEVRPDGKEVLVQSGWLRASVRALDPARSTDLQPLPTLLEDDAEPLVPGEFTPMRVEIYPFGHAFRAGSRVRLILTAPGGDRTNWTFDALPGTQDDEVARSVGRPSSINLPVVPGIDVPDALPACPGLRLQPCRTYTPPAS